MAESIDLDSTGSTAQALASLLSQALQSQAAAVVLGSYLEGRGVTGGTWRVELTEPPAFRIVPLGE
jgi:hypothetical protein